VREYRSGDLAELVELTKVAFPREMEVYGLDEESIRRQARLYGLVRLMQRLTGRFFFKLYVGEVGGELVGTTSLSREGEAWYIGMVMVAPAQRRRGYARALVERACEDARSQGVKRVILHVREDNTPAKNLYLSLGFELFERELHFISGVEQVGGETQELPQGYRLRRVGPFDRRAFDVIDGCREERSAAVYGRSYYPPLYLRLLFILFRPQLIERYAVLRDGGWTGVYTFRFTSRKEAAHASVRLYREHRGRGLERALLLQALARARELGAPKLAVVADERDKDLVAVCERLGFARPFTMEGMVRKL
jgi:ribosomal protein S18 acetylase RimI-like enzyme